ncbi:Prolyl-tRNA synthetase [Prochlorococcus marinus str. MIT 9515]|uniref:Proline--tRNA ligase n=1 Tax=Prochlorococcus marinus (strain MIT 9515) TaxID=167542 RepID=SYP_PROM5|nr:proline--tRNA ligase [Prochlorococcus marinus]A2BVH0.1 RecName: Full=Proline--tRNA ligase; AltName: Full=Prolyl-tRNA synthetase; Short=ProRS [Prochlorococcus marinus str. MIT 9515]ABM71781.1 Prolyl-tRNA synthetase [Prochlorococcus marinus str. MIT 9515]
MRVTTSFPLGTLRDTPSEAEIISHQLLLKGGYIRRVNSGIYAYMPIMLKVIEKISNIIEKELNNNGCSKLLLPQLHPAELWKRSERWEGYTAGEGIMFNLKDRQGKEFGLAPTHEEVITNIASEIINSYKQLPLCFYQIQTKFRDEIRPRFGLMRSREFIMKDGYSFHSSKEDLSSFYEKMERSYENIFKNCGLDTVGVDADSGAIGGAASKEFMVTADAGEDYILFTESGSYAANIEKAISLPSKEIPLKSFETEWLETPNQKSIVDICKENDLDASQIVKVVIFVAKFENKSQLPILTCIRGDQHINEIKLFNLISKKYSSNLISLEIIEDNATIEKNLTNFPLGYIGPDINDEVIKNSSSWDKSWIRIADHSANNLSSFVSGSNKVNFHKVFQTFSFIDNQFLISDIRNAKKGDRISLESNEELKEKRGIEIGHIFQLGQKYSEKLNAKFSDKDGKLKNLWMGCYGIGVTRIAQAAIEQNHDENGISWPIQISPFEILIIPTNLKDPYQTKLTEEIYKEFESKKIDVLLDDRDVRAGVKFKDADLIGIPFQIIIGRDSINKEVEFICRSSKRKIKISSQNLLEKFISESKILYNENS